MVLWVFLLKGYVQDGILFVYTIISIISGNGAFFSLVAGGVNDGCWDRTYVVEKIQTPQNFPPHPHQLCSSSSAILNPFYRKEALYNDTFMAIGSLLDLFHKHLR